MYENEKITKCIVDQLFVSVDIFYLVANFMINNALQINGIVLDVYESSTCTSYKGRDKGN